MLLLHELEKAAPISGVHVEAWNGCAFKEGDVVTVEGGKVRHKRSGKEAALAFAYRPFNLSTLPNAYRLHH